MKKKFLAFVLAVSGVVASSAAVYHTTCGVPVNSVDPEFFQTYGEWFTFMNDLNEIKCGTRGINHVAQFDLRKESYVLLPY